MRATSVLFKNSASAKPVLLLSLFVTVYWWLPRYFDVYSVAVLGALYELLWLPVLGLLFLLPLVAIAALVREKFSTPIPHLLAIVLCVATLLFMIFDR